jgi:hypothetical protein
MDFTRYLKQRLSKGYLAASSQASPERDKDADKASLIFLHVPKTAGTTVRAIIERQYPPSEVYAIYEGSRAVGHHSMADLKALPEAEKKKIKVYAGHVSYGLHELIPQPVHYYAMLRDPVDRIISYYHHTMHHNPKFGANKISLMKFFARKDPMLHNQQTQIISGIKAPPGACSDEMLWTAIDNINDQFCAVGITEMFDESILLLRKAMAWDLPEYVHENVSVDRPARDFFSEAEINLIKKNNQLDIMLYSYVRRQLQKQLDDNSAEFQEELVQFRRANAECVGRMKPRMVWRTLKADDGANMEK